MSKVKIKFLDTGYCKNFEKAVLVNGRWKIIHFPALSVLIDHPLHGKILFDTGYASHLFEHAKHFPLKLYTMLTPITHTSEESAAHQLKAFRIQPADIGHIIISHFHADHISGLRDFPNANFIYLPKAYESVKHLTGVSALHAAFIPGLIPADFEERSTPIQSDNLKPLPYSQFPKGFDLFGDGSVVAVELPGHAHGQIGVFLTLEAGEVVFLIADASWTSRAVRENIVPNWLGRLVLDDYTAFKKTLLALHLFQKEHPEILIVPPHCREFIDKDNK